MRHISLVALLLTAGCGGVASGAATTANGDRVRLAYTVSYDLSADAYDEAKAGADLARWVQVDAQVLPPGA